jgi:hypothetical protein
MELFYGLSYFSHPRYRPNNHKMWRYLDESFTAANNKYSRKLTLEIDMQMVILGGHHWVRKALSFLFIFPRNIISQWLMSC